MKAPEFPVALGVIRDVEAHTYDQALDDQIEEVRKFLRSIVWKTC